MSQYLFPLAGIVVAAVVFLWSQKRMASLPQPLPFGGILRQTFDRELAAGDSAHLMEHLSQCREGRWDERQVYAELFAQKIPADVLNASCAQGSALGFVLRGLARTDAAWDARGSGMAESVTEEGWEKFHQNLQDAKSDLLRATELDSADPTPWAALLRVCLGLNEEQESAKGYFNEAIARDPENYVAHKSMLVQLSSKWGGNNETMLAFARKVASEASPTSDLRGLLFFAHIELWLYLRNFQDDASGAEAYLKDPAVQAELNHAQDGLAAPVLAERPSTTRIRNAAAFWYYMTRDRERLLKEVNRIASAFIEAPWHYIDGDYGFAYRKAAAFALGGAANERMVKRMYTA